MVTFLRRYSVSRRIDVVIVLCGFMLMLHAGVRADNFGLAARVNGVDITRDKLEKTFNAYVQQRGLSMQGMSNPKRYKQMQRQVLDVLISQELLWQEAQKQNLIVSDQEVDQELERVKANFPSRQAFLIKIEEGGFTEARYAEEIKQRLSAKRLVETDIARSVTVTDQDVHDYYVTNQARFSRPDEAHVRHILIKVEANADQAAREAAKQKIDTILAEVRGGADFAALARQHSEGPSGPKGGDLGFVPRGRLVGPFEEAAFALQPGEISDVVQTRYGYHVIKMEARRGGGPVPEKEVAGRIRKYLWSTKVDQAIQERLNSLREAGAVEIFLSQ